MKRTRLVKPMLLASSIMFSAASSAELIYSHEMVDPASSHYGYGGAVAISGNRVAVTDTGHDEGGTLSAGSVHLFDASTGAFERTLVANDPSNYVELGSAVAIDGDRVFVGAERDGSNGPSSGSAYLFDAATGSQMLKVSVSNNYDHFGSSVAIDGNYLVAGAWGDDVGFSASGSAYVFDATTGTMLHQLTEGGNAGQNHFFGRSVAISGDHVVVGASGNNAAYVFSASTGSLVTTLTGTGGFGGSVAIDNGKIVVGATTDSENGFLAGAAYVFDLMGNQLAKLLASDGDAYNSFGSAVDISADRIVVGSSGYDVDFQITGATYLFDATDYSELSVGVTSSANGYQALGASVAIDGALIASSSSSYGAVMFLDDSFSVPVTPSLLLFLMGGMALIGFRGTGVAPRSKAA